MCIRTMSRSLSLKRYPAGFDRPAYGLLLKGTNQPGMTYYDPANYAGKVNPFPSIGVLLE
ncbi:hypothetical protein SAMN05446635_8337 [Burkholderia sp. OK233]|nr:hypothetical protein SAMN05446635_8337 [Burkholderia sp. OK233]